MVKGISNLFFSTKVKSTEREKNRISTTFKQIVNTIEHGWFLNTLDKFDVKHIFFFKTLTSIKLFYKVSFEITQKSIFVKMSQTNVLLGIPSGNFFTYSVKLIQRNNLLINCNFAFNEILVVPRKNGRRSFGFGKRPISHQPKT